MNPNRLGFASILVASACCALPIGAAALGLGSIGLGSLLGPWALYFSTAGLALIAVGWVSFLRERPRGHMMEYLTRKRPQTAALLSVATLVVLFFAGSTVAPLLGGASSSASAASAVERHPTSTVDQTPPPEGYLRKVLAVDGISCQACAPPIRKSLGQIDGVASTRVDVAHKTVAVTYDPAKVSTDQLFQAVKEAGFEARAAN